MSETVLIADTGRSTGSAEARRLRREDSIPAVVYGLGMEPLSISVARRDLRQALSGGSGMNTILDLTIDGTVYPAIVKDMQRHPVRRTVQHVDFIQIDLSHEIVVSVPVRLEGHAKAVLDEGGLVDLRRNDVEISTSPRNIPDEIVVDVSGMDMDTVITLGDLDLPSGVEVVGEPEWVVVTALTMRTPLLDEEEAEAEAAAEEGEAGEAGEAAAEDGEAAAGDDAE
jgi:large subunit ribosomal protein L25